MIPHSPTIEGFDHFLRRFQHLASSLERLRIGDFKSSFCRVSAGIQSLQNLGMEMERVSSPRFNIFSLLGVERLEVGTHSAILVDLLDPQGTHGQGDLFLKNFFQIYVLGDLDYATGQNWIIEKEKVTSWGNLDIVLSESAQKRCVVIENKIDAMDQPGQLARYYRWIQEGSPYSLKKSRLIYLTIGGFHPTASSFQIDGIRDIEIKEIRDKLILMSWKTDIRKWLRESLGEVQASGVRETLRQYLKIIEGL